MIPVDINEIENTARKEMAEARTKYAVNELKVLYAKKEKAALVVRNIDNEINAYKKEVADNLVYISAGVDTTKV